MRMRWAVQAVLVLVGLWLAPAGPAHAAPAETGRYYVVGPPVDGQREYLYAIALRTLGNGNRYREIVELNTGRAQPDGETFTDGLSLNPGWVLVLPRDAKGQGVRVGPLPRIRARSAPPAPRSVPPSTPAAPPPSSAAPPRSSAAPSRVPPSAPARPPATRGVAAPPRREPTTPAGLDPLVIRVGAGVLSVLLAVVAIVLLRPGRSGRGAVVSGDDGPWPPEWHHTPAPGDAARREPPGPATATAVSSTVDPSTAAGRPAVPDATSNAAPSGGERSVEGGSAETGAVTPAPAEAGSDEREPGPSTTSGVSANRPAGPPAPAADEPTTAGPVEPAVRAGRPTRAAGSGGVPVDAGTLVDLPRPPLPGGDDLPYLTADLDTDIGPARVRLVGVAAGRGAPPYAWVGPGETAPPAVLPLVLGRHGPWRLHVDLARVPDVLTLVGPVDVCRRAAATLTGGLAAAGVGVAVVGDALGGTPPDGCRRLTGLPEPPGPDDDLPAPCVVFVAGPSPAGARGLAAATGGHCVPVVLGPVPAGRWSLQLGADAPGLRGRGGTVAAGRRAGCRRDPHGGPPPGPAVGEPGRPGRPAGDDRQGGRGPGPGAASLHAGRASAAPRRHRQPAR
ncbi:hypothetical protein [Micromonospora sp. WMMD980]|uniref:hypothetical protein n=1 Tax=Micromonospora sp. WMMD980 TaxID=3016088 RepID=UPI0024160075|nr:hypothetical protein [Micromonospora sp. WMMD980]MDG4800287.1 hypothetical protein [Micromonospora sp. WMMD980]